MNTTRVAVSYELAGKLPALTVSPCTEHIALTSVIWANNQALIFLFFLITFGQGSQVGVFHTDNKKQFRVVPQMRFSATAICKRKKKQTKILFCFCRDVKFQCFVCLALVIGAMAEISFHFFFRWMKMFITKGEFIILIWGWCGSLVTLKLLKMGFLWWKLVLNYFE